MKPAAFSKAPVSKDCEESEGRVPRPVLGSRTALLGLELRPLLLTRVLGGVSVGVPRLRGRALRAFWDIESGWVFTPLHLTAKWKTQQIHTRVCTCHMFTWQDAHWHQWKPIFPTIRFVACYNIGRLYLLQSSTVLQKQDWSTQRLCRSPVGRQSPPGRYRRCWNKRMHALITIINNN